MEVNLQKIQINKLLSIGTIIIILLAIDLVMRIYLNWHQIEYYREQNNNNNK